MTERSIKSAERTLALFELFSAVESPLSVGEIAKALNMPHSSVSMLVQNLNSIGYLNHDPRSRRYWPSIRILLLSSWVSRRFSETGKIAESLDRLQEAIGETVLLSIQHNARIQIILGRGPDRTGQQFSVPGRSSDDRLMIRSGFFGSLTCTAIGRAILSLKPDQEVLALIRRANAETDNPRYRVGEPQLLEELEKVRRDGYAETRGAYSPEVGALAVAIPSPMDSIPLAISVSMPLERFPAKKPDALDALIRFREQFWNDHHDTVGWGREALKPATGID